MLFFFPMAVLPLASEPWQATHWLLKMPWPVEAREAFDEDPVPAVDADGLVPMVSFAAGALFGGGGGFFGSPAAPVDEAVSAAAGPEAFFADSRFSFALAEAVEVEAVAVDGAAAVEALVEVVSAIAPVDTVVSVRGAVAVSVVVVSATVDVVSLLLVVATFSDCLQPASTRNSAVKKIVVVFI